MWIPVLVGLAVIGGIAALVAKSHSQPPLVTIPTYDLKGNDTIRSFNSAGAIILRIPPLAAWRTASVNGEAPRDIGSPLAQQSIRFPATTSNGSIIVTWADPSQGMAVVTSTVTW